MFMEIYLNDILHLDPDEYDRWTICLNNATDDIYSFDENPDRLLEHISWKRHSGAKASFRIIDTPFCLQFIRLDHDKKFDQWLFVGAFEKRGVVDFEDGHQTYDLEPMERFSNLAERLVIDYKKKQGPKQVKIEIAAIEGIRVVSILEKKYVQTSRPFEGYHKVSLPFTELEKIINGNVDNWRILLENVNCVYSILDKSNGKMYIGSTYNRNGTWSRWSEYVKTHGHGGDQELKKLIDQQPDYARNFEFSIVEVFLNKDDASPYIQERERYWKNIFKTEEFGYNRN